MRRGLAACALAMTGLAGCVPAPPPVARVPPPPVVAPEPILATPLPPPRLPDDRPDPMTGLPRGWYVPSPPPIAETGADPAPAPVAAAPLPTQPPPDPERRTQALLRGFPWVAGFWVELGPEERARAERAFARRGTREGLAEAWDRMGLGDRVLLLFGPGRGQAQAGD